MSSNNFKYPSSEGVYVFPFGNTRALKPGSRVLNEQNLTRMIRSLTNNPNYVVEYREVTEQNGSSTFDIMFVMNGYLFEIQNINSYIQLPEAPTSSTYLYASVDIHDDQNGVKYLQGSDELGPQAGNGSVDSPYELSVTYNSLVVIPPNTELYFKPVSGCVLTITSSVGLKINNEEQLITEKVGFDLKDINNNTFSLKNTGLESATVRFLPEGATDSTFSGVKLTTTNEKMDEPNYLCLLEYNSANVNLGVPRESYIKHTTSSINLGSIVCGNAVTGWHKDSTVTN